MRSFSGILLFLCLSFRFHFFFIFSFFLCGVFLWGTFPFFLCAAESETGSVEGRRPYELDWAGRMNDEVPAFLDFELPKSEGETTALTSNWNWRLQTVETEAAFERSREQKIWGNCTAKLTYRCTSEKPQKTPSVDIFLDEPMELAGNPNVPKDFDAISCWIYGNNWSWAPISDTPQTSLSAVFLVGEEGKEMILELCRIGWKEWFLVYQRLTPEQIQKLRTPGTRFLGFRHQLGRNTEERTIFLDNLAFRKDSLEETLEFTRRPKRGVVIPEQDQGLNTGTGTLPFPTCPETILPQCLTPCANGIVLETSSGRQTFDAEALNAGKLKEQPLSGSVIFTARSTDGLLEFRCAPSSTDCAPWDSLAVRWNSGEFFFPMKSAGIQELALPDGKTVPVQRHEFLSALLKKDGTLETRWKIFPQPEKEQTDREVFFAEAVYSVKLAGKSLILETRCPGGNVSKVTYGTFERQNIQNPRLVPIPYCTYAYSGKNRPAAVVFQESGGKTLFLMGSTDWYLGNGSLIYSHLLENEKKLASNGGVSYLPQTNGKRNDCFERFFVTVSPHFEEILPTIPNPPSPWIGLSGKKQWHARGAVNREKDREYWYRAWRHGIREMIVLDHEVGWRDGGESFTFRTKTAPGKGGDEGQRQFSRFMNHDLGYFYGPYNNFTDFAPVNEFWTSNMPSRTVDGQFQKAWPRCYAPKPARAVEYCEKLTPINQKKYQFRCGYCDVHTAVSPSDRVDYDSRVPGAGTWAGTFYAYGEIMLLQKQGWGGPVFSEGPMHHFYAGLNDGSYAQDQGYRFAENPWLVDYDLLKLHPLSTNIGMGNLVMFYCSRLAFKDKSPQEQEEMLDRFFAATLAFGHPGYLTIQHGIQPAWRGYFGALALQCRYTQCQPEKISYCSADGKLYSTSQAVANGTFKRSQVVVRYADGTVICANGSASEMLETHADGHPVSLPPTGYAGWTKDGKVFTFSGTQFGTRCDYAVSPDYVYFDGRGKFHRFPCAAGSGAGVCRKVDETHWEIIPLQNAEIGFRIPDFARITDFRQLGSPDGKEKSNALPLPTLEVTAEADALSFDGKELGKTRVTRSRGWFYVQPVKEAFSYRIRTRTANPSASSAPEVSVPVPEVSAASEEGESVPLPEVSAASEEGESVPAPEVSALENSSQKAHFLKETEFLPLSETLSCPRFYVQAGEMVQIKGEKGSYSFQIPEESLSGTRLWFEAEGSRIDFGVLDLCACSIHSENAKSVTLQIQPQILEFFGENGTEVRTVERTEPVKISETDFKTEAETDTKIDAEIGTETEEKKERETERKGEGKPRFTEKLEEEPLPISVTFQGKDFPVKNGFCTIPLPAIPLETPTFHQIQIAVGSKIQTVGIQTECRLEEVPWNFTPEKCEKWMQMRDQTPTNEFGKSGAVVHFGPQPCGGVELPGFFTHPPYLGGLGRVFFEYVLDLPKDCPLAFSAMVGKKDKCDVGDGIWYQIALLEENVPAEEKILAETSVNVHEWTPLRADLSPWAGKRVRLRLISDCGPKNNTQGDWGIWGDLKLVSVEKQTIRKSKLLPGQVLFSQEAELTKPVSAEMLRRVSNAWLCWRGKGLAGSGPRPTHAYLNGIPLGNLTPAAGNETIGEFSPEVRLSLTREAISALKIENLLSLSNPQSDCFSIRDFRLLLELEDGTQISSPIFPAVYTQPNWWAHAEGILIPEKEIFFIPIWFKQ